MGRSDRKITQSSPAGLMRYCYGDIDAARQAGSSCAHGCLCTFQPARTGSYGCICTFGADVELADRFDSLFSVDARAHAINEDAGQPPEAYVARCGQWLLSAINLYDEPPDSEWICLSCLRWTNPRTPPRGTP